jgi:glycosyltransferase involved in cell wall biosynthesis
VRIEFAGQVAGRSQLIEFYSRADLFWFASKLEGMPNVVAEAMVCGTPVVTLPVMGIMKSVLLHAEDGEIVDTEDAHEFARVVDRWLEKKIDRAALSRRARERFNVEKVDAQYIARFREIVGSQASFFGNAQEPAVLISEKV